MTTVYRGMVKRINESVQPVPVKWSGEIFYTPDYQQLAQLLRTMQQSFPQNSYTVEQIEF